MYVAIRRLKVQPGVFDEAVQRDESGLVPILRSVSGFVEFDVVPPLQYVGADAMRKRWEEAFSSLPGPIGYEIADLSITVGEDMAFTHSFNQTSATLPTGQKIGVWVRWTACWRKIGGKWLLVHDQISVPVDLQTGRAVLDLKP